MFVVALKASPVPYFLLMAFSSSYFDLIFFITMVTLHLASQWINCSSLIVLIMGFSEKIMGRLDLGLKFIRYFRYQVKHMLERQDKSRLIGPNCPGIIKVGLLFCIFILQTWK